MRVKVFYMLLFLSIFASTYSAHAQEKKKSLKRQVFTIGESDIAGKISQPQALYLLQQSAVETTFPEPKDKPAERIWDTVFLDVFEP